MPDDSVLPLDCPFCGSAEVEIARTNPASIWVQCALCGARTESAAVRREAIEKWNDRESEGVSAVIVDDMDAAYQAYRQRKAAPSPGGAQ